MSFSIPFSLLDDETTYDMIATKTTIKQRSGKSFIPGDLLVAKCYDMVPSTKGGGRCYLPLGMWSDIYDTFPMRKWKKLSSTKNSIELFSVETDPKGYRDQNIVYELAVNKLSANHAVLLALPTGFGKTTLGIKLSCHLGLKTLILCHISIVNKRWLADYQKLTGLQVQLVKGKKLDPKADVYIMGVLKAKSFSRQDFSDIGTVIFDEAHIASMTAFTETLFLLQPKYLIGLSATPFRTDGMDGLFNPFFGNDFIYRKEIKNFTIYKVCTPFVPDIEFKKIGNQLRLDWTTAVNSLAYNPKRQDFVAELAVKNYKEHRILILTDRTELANQLYKKCRALLGITNKKDSTVQLLVGKTSTYDKDCRILIAGMKKAGVGFDDDTLTMLIMASDTQQIIQYEGRIRTSNNVIYHLVDNCSTCENHWNVCQEWYVEKEVLSYL